jgi:hypothetical protein
MILNLHPVTSKVQDILKVFDSVDNTDMVMMIK